MVCMNDCPGKEGLAERCQMGDVAAMAELAEHFWGLCSPEVRELFAAYEARPEWEQMVRLDDYLKDHFAEAKPAEAYLVWLVRAALYGNDRVRERIDRLPYYTDYGKGRLRPLGPNYSFLPVQTLTCRCPRRSEPLGAGALLRDAGFPAVPEKNSCYLRFWPNPGAFQFSYVDSYIPADEYGFGSETDYAHLWLDEFFCPLDVKDKADIPGALERLDRIREEYWRAPAREGQKYRQLQRVSPKLP